MYREHTAKIVVTIEARMASERLPGKVLLPVVGKPMLQHIIERLRRSQYIDEVIVATTTKASDEVIVDFCSSIDCLVFQGSADNIVERLLGASKLVEADIIVQATGDNPVIDPNLVDRAIELFFSGEYDYVCNNMEPSYPIGLDVRMFTRESLLAVARLTNDPVDLIHGSYFIYRRPDIFKITSFKAEDKHHWPDLRLTVDEPADYKLIQMIYQKLYANNKEFNLSDVIEFLKQNREFININANVRQKIAAEG